jgi:hypothetical protein
MKVSKPLAFLKQAEEDPKLDARILAAVERGNKVTADEILQIAEEFGYTFTKSEFQKEVKRAFITRFAAVQDTLDALSEVETREGKKPPKKNPPLSSCFWGCVSYTINWHPRPPTPR